MYVIVDIAGQQYKVEKDQKIFVNRLEGEAGNKVDFDQVLLVDDDGKVQVGMPVVKNMIVSASIVSHLKGDTVKVFKKKRRKGYQKLNGHRQSLTELLIESIGEGEIQAKPAAKKESQPKADKKEIQAEAVTESKAPAKTKAKKEEGSIKAKPVAKVTKETKEKKAAAGKAASPAKKTSSAKAAPKAKKSSKE
jgi:large subunit ribosomal protein L21